MDEGWQHEGLDRTHTLIVMLEQLLGFYDPDCEFSDNNIHPAIWNKACLNDLRAATSALLDLYQHIVEWEDDNGTN